jgi:hypothetical protein
MTCRDVDSFIVAYASGAEVSPQVAAHIDGCGRCRPLVHAIRESGQTTRPSPEQLNRATAALVTDLKPVKPLVSEGALLLMLMLVLMVVAAVGGEEWGTAGFHALTWLQSIAVFIALGCSAVVLAFSAGRQIVPGSRLLLPPRMLLPAVLGVTTGMFAILFHPHHESTFVTNGLMCLRIGLECAIPAALLLWLLLRRGAILDAPLTGATVGALAGLGGVVVLEILCPNLSSYHILAWHIGAAFASTMGGLIIGYITERLRS